MAFGDFGVQEWFMLVRKMGCFISSWEQEWAYYVTKVQLMTMLLLLFFFFSLLLFFMWCFPS